jgi:lysophospholipase L1-like esterase
VTGVFASDSRIAYVGRSVVSQHTVSFDWSGTYVRFAFEGTELRLRCSDSGRDFFNVWIDREMSAEPDTVVVLSGDTVVTLYTDTRKRAKPAFHQVILQKRTEGEQGVMTLREVLVRGELMPALPTKERYMEFVGDSYTCGFGAENSVSTDAFSPATETATKSYAAIIARAFDADYVLVAHSGMGVCRNYNSKFAGRYMPDRYLQAFDTDTTVQWTPAEADQQPAITVVMLGGNDFSTGVTPQYEDFAAHYMQLLASIKGFYGQSHPVLCCTKKGNRQLADYVRRVTDECGLERVYFATCFEQLFHDDDRELGACSHPNYEAHRKMAHALLPYVATITGWEMPDKTLR